MRTQSKYLARMESELRLRGFTENTIKSYLIHVKNFLKKVGKDPAKITEEDVKDYISQKMIEEGLSTRTIACIMAALRFFFSEVMKKEDVVRFKPPKQEKKLPTVLTREEVRALIDAAENIKHKALVELLYSSGLRISECLNLKVKDIDFNNLVGVVRGGKGKKDRIFIVSRRAAEDLQTLIIMEDKSSEDYIFTGKNRNRPMTPRAAQKIISNLSAMAGITKNVTPHVLRHSFATHLLEAGVDIRRIQELLGHANLNTTQIYTKVSTKELMKIKSPLDEMD